MRPPGPKYSLNWQNMFCEPTLANSLYSNEFALVDLTVMPDNQIMRHRRMAMLELLQKHIRRRDLAELQDQLITLLTQEHLTRSQISVLIHYMLQVGNTTDPGALIRKLASSAPQYKEQLMSIAEWLEEKGRADGLQKGMQQGMQQGRQKGLEEGRQAEARSIALKMLDSGLAPDLITHLTGLSPEELSALSH